MVIRSNFLHQLVIQTQRRKVADFNLVWFHEDSGLAWAGEIALSTNTPVIFPSRLVEFNAHPDRQGIGTLPLFSRCIYARIRDLRDGANKANGASPDMGR